MKAPSSEVNMHDAQVFQLIAAGIQSILVTLALLIGGIWTLYTFRALYLKQKAQAELAKTEAEIFRQAVVKIIVDARQEMFGGETRCIAADVTVENLGNRNTKLDFSSWCPFRV